MSVDEDIVLHHRSIVLVIDVSVCEEDASAAFHKKGVVSEYGELKQDLSSLSIAVASNGNNLILHGVKSLDDSLGVDSLRNAVARSVVEDVAKDEKHVIRAALIEVEHALKGWQAAVYVGNK